MHIGFWFERDHFLDQDTDGRILSKCILKKQDGRFWSGCIWLGLWTSDGLILMPQRAFKLHKIGVRGGGELGGNFLSS